MHLPNYFRLYVLPVPEGPCKRTPLPYLRLLRMEVWALRMSEVLIMRFHRP